MAQITTVALQSRDVKQYVGAVTPLNLAFSPTLIAATVTNGDRILIATLPANAKIVGCSLKLTGTSGLTAIAHLQTTEPTANNIFLTPTSGAAAAPSIALATMMTLPHENTLASLNTTGTRDLELVCATGSLSITNGLLWYISAQYAFFP